MVGLGKVYDSLDAYWMKELETMRDEALPMIAISPGLVPSVLLDVEKRPGMQQLIEILQSAGSDLEYLVVWCALIASDLSVADSFLLVKVRSPIECKFTLRFHLIRHRTQLEMIDKARKVAIRTGCPDEMLVIDVNVPDLGEQLASLQEYQEDRA